MTADIIIVSGFLGAGKTTLIQKWLAQGVFTGKVAIVENDFGEVGVDAALLRSGEVVVSELSAGCICCSLAGDFVRALEELIARHAPDVILIEPSGVGMLSDVRNACAHPRVQSLARVLCAVTVVDVTRIERYLDNFGAFYADQIRRADAVVLSRVEQAPDRVAGALERVIALNTRARVVSAPWDSLDAREALFADAAKPDARVRIGRRSGGQASQPRAETADDVFDTVTIHTPRVFTPEELHQRLQRAEQACGMLIRAKGILRCPGGHCLVQYTEGETQIEPSAADGDFLCLIGQGLERDLLNHIFTGD